MRIVKFLGSVKYRIDEQFQDLIILWNLHNLKKKINLEIRPFFQFGN